MNHQLQVSNEKEDKSSSSQEEEEENEESFQENVQENQHLQKWANYFTPPNATLITKHQNNTQCPSHKEELKKVSQKRKPKEAKQDVMEVHGSRIVRATGRKDRHSKISTATGPKDRRVRLSPNTAIQFYDVQDRLGYDRPSKAIDWLIEEAQTAIDALEKIGSTNKALNWQTIYAENEKGQFALEESWSADKKTELEELARHSSKLNATMQYSADQFPEKGYKEQTSKVCQSLNNSQIGNLSLFSSANDAKIQSFCEFQTYPQGHLHSETEKQPTNDAKIQSFCALQNYPQGHFHSVTKNQSAQLGSFFNFQSSHQNESINFSSDHHQGFLTTKSNLELREDSTFSFSPHNFTSILGQNQLFNYQREPLQSSSNFPQTISYSNIGFANDGLLVTSNAPIIQEEEEHGTLSSTLSAINATTLLHYQD